MNNNIENFVEIIENKSKKHTIEEMICVCKRIKNPKRDYLFINKYQGNDVPQNPSKVFEMYDEFVDNIAVTDEKIAIIGFAETATAIGNYVAAKLPNCIYEMQTTREDLLNEEPIIEFFEEHSHAKQQLLYGRKEFFKNIDRVMFVEDEITTGHTILNAVNQLKSINPNLKYSVASILNWQDEESEKKYKELGIDTYCLIKGKIKDVNAKVDMTPIEESKNEKVTDKKITCTNIKCELCNSKENRIRTHLQKDVDEYSKYIYDIISEKSKLAKEVKNIENKNVLVVGTEEFMYEPMLFASYLEKNTKNNIKYCATTRKPIEVSNENNYILNTRNKLSSAYDEQRTTYFYNLEKSDYVFIIADNIVKQQFCKDIANIFYNKGYDLDKVEIVSLHFFLFFFQFAFFKLF